MKKHALKIGLALGGGGVRGVAHVPVLELLDEMKIRPHLIAGTSAGSIIGALYAGGMSGRAIRELILRNRPPKRHDWKNLLEKKNDLLKWLAAFVPDFKKGGLLKSERFLDLLFEGTKAITFEQLDIPLQVVATDYWNGSEVVFDTGDLLPAIRASIAVPGVFAPVQWNGRILVDGGIVNQVPYENLLPACDITIAVDVAQERSCKNGKPPGIMDSIVGSFEITQERLLELRRLHTPPTCLVRPLLHNINLFDFDKVDDIFEQTAPAVAQLHHDLTRAIKRKTAAGG